jgi:L-lactate permease
MELSPEGLILLASAVLSLLFAYVPKLSDWWDTLEAKAKALGMALLLLLVAVSIYGLACYSGAPFAGLPTCEAGLGWNLAEIFVLALLGLAGNQGTYLLMVRPFKPVRTEVAELTLKAEAAPD